MQQTGWPQAERAAREAYGRLVAYLAWQWHDLAAAEDALSEALLSALTHWPRDGVPASPEGWLMTAARRVLLQQHRHRQVEQAPEVWALFDEEACVDDTTALPDRRLQLLLVCAHPLLPARDHAPLMLQAVLGVQAQDIARAFLVSPSAMAQRLVRAKARIREAGLAFELPAADELQPRLAAVLEGLYGAYTIGSDIASPAPEADAALRDEALYLAALVARLLPDAAEALGLLALLLHVEARRPAQFSEHGQFMPLLQQDTAMWNRPLMRQAEAALRRAATLHSPGPFQLEAAIQSAHTERARTGHTPWEAIAQLYGLLTEQHGGIGPRIGQAVALGEAGRVDAALAQLAELPADTVAAHQPYWVALAHLRGLAGQQRPADAALQRAAGLTADGRVRRFLLGKVGGI